MEGQVIILQPNVCRLRSTATLEAQEANGYQKADAYNEAQLFLSFMVLCTSLLYSLLIHLAFLRNLLKCD